MSFVSSIVNTLYTIADWFWSAYLEVAGWVWPFYNLAYPLYYLYVQFQHFAWSFYDFGVWVNDAVSQIADKISWASLTSWFSFWQPYILTAYNWVINAVSNVTNTVNSWWSATSTSVLFWISTATQGLAELKAAWSTFWSVTLPTLVNVSWLTSWWTSRLTDVGNLINSAFTLRSGLWEGWQEVRTGIVSFITAPLDWLWERFADWFLGGE